MKNKGFTLIELMIVVAIISILITVVMPSYRHYVLESQRNDTQGKLLQMLELQERFYLDAFTYTTTLGGDPDVELDGLYYPTDLQGRVVVSYNGTPAFLIEVQPCLVDPVLYADITAPAINHLNRCFRLIATPQGDQVNDGGLVVDNRGRRIHDFASIQPRDWNDNDLGATDALREAACPECGDFPPASY
jgi:type IV pilus assembly protein PilE